MNTYHIIAQLNQELGEYCLVPTEIEDEQKIKKAIRDFKSETFILGIRVTDISSGDHIDYWYGRSLPIEQAVGNHWLPMNAASFMYYHGIIDVIKLKDGHCQGCDITNQPISALRIRPNTIKRSRRKKQNRA